MPNIVLFDLGILGKDSSPEGLGVITVPRYKVMIFGSLYVPSNHY